MLPSLGDEPMGRDFQERLATLQKTAPEAAFTAYFQGILAFEEGRRKSDSSLWDKAAQDFEEAVKRDGKLAEAHAALALLRAAHCQPNAALAAITEAEALADSLAPGRYLVQRALILARSPDGAKRAEGRVLLEAQSASAEAALQQAMLDGQEGRWAEARGALARARNGMAREKGASAWMLFPPGDPWLVGKVEDKACLIEYGAALAGRLAEDGKGVAAAWRALLDRCGAIEPLAQALLCSNLPEQKPRFRRFPHKTTPVFPAPPAPPDSRQPPRHRGYRSWRPRFHRTRASPRPGGSRCPPGWRAR
jgi:tetratricopeptide (TPR) repeat protein